MNEGTAYITAFDWAVLVTNIAFALIGSAIALALIDHMVRRALSDIKGHRLMQDRRRRWSERHTKMRRQRNGAGDAKGKRKNPRTV